MRSRSVWGVMAVLVVCAASAAAGAEDARTLREAADQLTRDLDDERQRFREAGADGDRCIIGLGLAHDGRSIVSVGEDAAELGFADGDAIARLGGEAWDADGDPDLAFARWKKRDRISVEVDRAATGDEDGTRAVTITGACPHSGRDLERLLDDVVIVLNRDRPAACLEKLDAIEVRFAKSARLFLLRLACFYRAVEKSGGRSGAADEYAEIIVGHFELWIRSASYDADALEAMRPDVDRVTRYLAANDLARHARRIDAAYRAATGAPSDAPAPVPGQGAPPSLPLPTPTPTPSGRESVFYGSCFFVTPDGLVATNAHVIQGKSKIRVIDSGGVIREAEIVKRDPGNDLALLDLDVADHDYLSLAPDGALEIGQNVFTMGFPATSILGREPKFTDGVISSLTGLADVDNLMQMTVPIQPGNSGGPVVNEEGQVVGVATSTAAVEVFLREMGTLPQNVNWAVKARHLRAMMGSTPAERLAQGRADAIRLTSKAVCRVEAR